MTDAEWRALRPGDVLRHKLRGDAQVVVTGWPYVVVVRTTMVSNPDEWEQVGMVAYPLEDARAPGGRAR